MRLFVRALAVLGLLGGGWTGFAYLRERDEKERSAMWRTVNAVRGFQAMFLEGDLDGNGVHDYWTADVAGLLAPFSAPVWDVDPRELAAADVAPLVPRSPRPYYGYYAVVVRWDPATDPEGAGDFAVCLYPASYAPGKDTWYVTNYGRFKSDTGGAPVRRWLSREELRMWSRCC
ncbi:MAG TPA: hypothetical protein VF950_23645 [Planctomycetota bacterium]